MLIFCAGIFREKFLLCQVRVLELVLQSMLASPICLQLLGQILQTSKYSLKTVYRHTGRICRELTLTHDVIQEGASILAGKSFNVHSTFLVRRLASLLLP